MASKKPPAGDQFKPKMWVRYELDEKELYLVKEWRPAFDEMDLEIAKALGTVYRCGLSYDERNSCWLVVMQTKHDEGPHSNLLLSARGSTPLKAFKQLVYKHLEIFREKWPPRDDLETPFVLDD